MSRRIVARELEIRHIETACLSSYHAQDRGEVQIIKAPEQAGDGSGWLIIDDLVDTGETGKVLRKMMPKGHFATVYANPRSSGCRYLYHRSIARYLDFLSMGLGTAPICADCRQPLVSFVKSPLAIAGERRIPRSRCAPGLTLP